MNPSQSHLKGKKRLKQFLLLPARRRRKRTTNLLQKAMEARQKNTSGHKLSRYFTLYIECRYVHLLG